MIIIPAIQESFRSLRDKTIKLVFETSELSPEQLNSIVNNNGSFGYLAFKKESFSDAENILLKSLKSDFEDTGKTPSQRFRAVLYRNFEQNKEGYSVFEDYYKAKYEILINHYKNKLV